MNIHEGQAVDRSVELHDLTTRHCQLEDMPESAWWHTQVYYHLSLNIHVLYLFRMELLDVVVMDMGLHV